MASEPSASRPRFDASYGIHADVGGLLPWSWAIERLERARSYWIATSRPEGGPHAMPVWGIWLDGALVFGSGRESQKARNLATNPALVVHLESADEVVIIEGEAEEVEPTGLSGLAEAYERKYELTLDLASPGGAWYAVRPSVAYAWRERDYPESATRFAFDSPR